MPLPRLIAAPLFPWFLAALLPVLPAVSRSPDTSFFNTMAALLGWGAAMAWTGLALGGRPDARSLGAGLLAAALLGWALASSGTQEWGLLLGAACLLLGWAVGRRPGWQVRTVTSLFAGYTLAVLAALLICSVQFFAPGWADGAWIAASQTVGRAVGNLRQPNLQATMAIWGVIAAAWLASRHERLRPGFPLVLGAGVFTVALTGSRTGMLLTGLLLLWGLLDRGLLRTVRRWLMAAPLLMFGAVQALSFWAREGGGLYFAAVRAQAGGDPSSSRFAIWSNTLELIRDHPWTGVGWGNFNFAWTLTPFPGRPVAFFDHTHSLPLQLAVELGVPTAILICGGVLWWSWRARAALTRPDLVQAGIARAALVMLLAVLFHSLLEYPLWYAYFLLPSAFLWGLYLGIGAPQEPRTAVIVDACAPRAGGTGGALLGRVLLVAGIVTLLGGLYAVWDYGRITQIYAPSGAAGVQPLQERIEKGQGSGLFGVHADYAAVTTAARPSEASEAFEGPLHRLIDARLMIAYARALHERSERDKAVYLAQRLREFRHPLGDKFFAPCEAPPPLGEAPPFQCERAPVMHLSYRDFQPPFR